MDLGLSVPHSPFQEPFALFCFLFVFVFFKQGLIYVVQAGLESRILTCFSLPRRRITGMNSPILFLVGVRDKISLCVDLAILELAL